jgi:hypothetical protein
MKKKNISFYHMKTLKPMFYNLGVLSRVKDFSAFFAAEALPVPVESQRLPTFG